MSFQQASVTPDDDEPNESEGASLGDDKGSSSSSSSDASGSEEQGSEEQGSAVMPPSPKTPVRPTVGRPAATPDAATELEGLVSGVVGLKPPDVLKAMAIALGSII